MTTTETNKYIRLLRRLKTLNHSWIEAAEILKKIRDERLYLGEYSSFNQFCACELGRTDLNIRYKIRAGEIAKAIHSEFGIAICNDHAAALIPLRSEERIAAFKEAMASSGTGMPTKQQIKEVVQRRDGSPLFLTIHTLVRKVKCPKGVFLSPKRSKQFEEDLLWFIQQWLANN